MRTHVQQNLDRMLAQERQLKKLVQSLEQELLKQREQLALTQGAVQVLQHVLNTYEEAADADLPAPASTEDENHASN